MTYSGTVSAAMEATLMGIPAFSISLRFTCGEGENFQAAASFAAKLANHMHSRAAERYVPECEHSDLPPDNYCRRLSRARGKGVMKG